LNAPSSIRSMDPCAASLLGLSFTIFMTDP
jgi:hypothetical protein